MSTVLLPDGRMQTRLDASQWIEAPPRAPFGMGSAMVYHNMYPAPGSASPPLPSPPDATLSAFSSFAPSTGDANYFPNYQAYDIVYPYPPTGFIPPIENPAPSINAANFQVPHYSFYMPVGTTTGTGTTAVLLPEDTGHLGQPFQFTFQCPFPTQPEAAFFQDQRQDQYYVQVAQEDLVVEESPREPEEPHSEDSQTSQESYAPPVEPEVRLHSNQRDNISLIPFQRIRRRIMFVSTTRQLYVRAMGYFALTFCAQTRAPPSRLRNFSSPFSIRWNRMQDSLLIHFRKSTST